MTTMVRKELLKATDEQIDDAVNHAEAIVLRGLLYQLTGDEEIANVPHSMLMMGFRGELPIIIDPEHVAFLRKKAADYLKAYRDAGAGEVPLVEERLHRAIELTNGAPMPDAELGLWIEQMALDPMGRSFDWKQQPTEAQKQGFLVAVIGAGMGGLNAGMQLKKAGIPYVVIEKNAQVGGTWHENRYPGARVDTPSRNYFHAFAVDYPCPNPFCPQEVNEAYMNWIADEFALRDSIEFNTEVTSIRWNEKERIYDIVATGPDGERRWQANAVISCIGFLNRPNMPELDGAKSFKGEIIHTSRWPKNPDFTGKRVAVIGSGATSYQMVPELAKVAGHLTMFQRAASWCFDTPGYLSPYQPQVNWLDVNFPYLVNFNRLWISYLANPDNLMRMIETEPGFEDPHAVSPNNKLVRDHCIALMERKMPGRPDLVEKMIPVAPPLSSRPVLVDADYNIYDALMRDNVELVVEPIEALTPKGIRTADGVEHEFDIIVYATGFKANDFLWPMEVRGKDGKTVEELWAKDGARAYIGTMMPGFPNFFMIYGPNMNPFFNGLGAIEMEEMATRFALQCIEQLILQDRKEVNVTQDAYDRFNAELDRREATKVYADYRVTNYYKNDFGRSAVNCPFDVRFLWNWWLDPADRDAPILDHTIKPKIGADLEIA